MIPCFECGAPATQDHHVIPRSRGGTKTVPLCHGCHGLAHGRGGIDTSTLTKEALAAKKIRGEVIGQVPYGSQREGKGLQPNLYEQQVIAFIRLLREDGYSIRGIANRLNDGSIPARGTKWYPTTVARILTACRARVRREVDDLVGAVVPGSVIAP